MILSREFSKKRDFNRRNVFIFSSERPFSTSNSRTSIAPNTISTTIGSSNIVPSSETINNSVNNTLKLEIMIDILL